MSQIPWGNVPEPVVEQMIAVLLSNIHHGDAARIDGRGGDGGRDVQITTPDGIRAFEIKSFASRMTPGRRSKVQASLTRAATLAPLDWTLLVPIDPNPKELAWFDWLRTTVTFPITWRGLTWLDGEFAQRPFIARYYLEDRKDELIDLAKLLRQEEAVLAGGAPDAMDRTRRLVERANDLDPFYKFRISSDGTTTSIDLLPRYPGAERDRPITGSFQFVFPKDEPGRTAAEQFQRAMDFGTGYAVPPEYLKDFALDAPAGLGQSFEKGRIELLPSRPSGEERDLVMAIVDPAGATLAEVPVAFRILHEGDRGSILQGVDRTRTMTVDVTVDGREGRLGIKITTLGVPFYPSEMRPLAKFLAGLARPNEMALRTPEGDEISKSKLEMEAPMRQPGFPALIEDLVLVQWASGMTRKVSPLLSVEDAQAIRIASILVRGEPIALTWTTFKMELADHASEDIRRRLLTEGLNFRLRTPQPHVAVIDGVSYPVGKGMEVVMTSARLGPGHSDWRAAGIIPAGVAIELVPGESDQAEARLISV